MTPPSTPGGEIRISTPLLGLISDAAEAAFPAECCGLLAGHGNHTAGFVVTRVIPSDNVAETDHHDSFEVDPQVRFDLMRELGEIGDGPKSDERMIGHYHSHPNHPAEPSARDLAKAFEPDLVWVIVGVKTGKTDKITAHILHPQDTTFQEIPLLEEARTAYPADLEDS